jgi:O-antigen ligase
MKLAHHHIYTALAVPVVCAIALGIGYASMRVSPVYVLGAVGSLALGLFIMRKPFWGLLLLAFFIPFERLGSYDIGGVTVRLSQVTSLLTMAAVFCTMGTHRQQRLPRIPIVIPLVLFFVVGLFGLVDAPNTERSVLVFLFTIFSCLISVLVPFLVRTPEQVQRILKWFFASFLLVTVFGIYQFVGDFIGLPPELTGLRELYTKDVLGFPRVQSTALEPLYFANYLLVPLSVLLSLFLMRDRTFSTPKLLLFIGLGGVNLVLTVARGGYIAFAVCVAVLFFIHFFRLCTWRNFFYGSLAVIITAFVAVRLIGFDTISTQFLGHVTNLFSGASYNERVEMFSIAKRAWTDHPLVGIGPGSFGPYASHHPYIVPEHGWNIVNNEYLELLAENGTFGLVLMLCVFAIVVIRSIKALLRVRDPYVKAVLSGVFAGFLGILVQYNTFSILYIVHIWFTIGLLLALQNLVLQPSKKTT